MKCRIEQELNKIEKNLNVKIIYACESGSRAWNFASLNSDYDVRFIYAHPKDWYLSIAKKKDVIEHLIDGDLDISGWDIKKSLVLLRKSNSPLLEWISSPIKYRNERTVMNPLIELSTDAFLPESSCHHYWSMANRILLNVGEGEEAKIKSYLYSLRAILCCKWIVKRHTQPPMRIEELLNELLPVGETRDLVDNLIYEKSKGAESASTKRSLSFEEYLRGQLSNLESQIPKNPKKLPIDRFDAVFQEIISRCNT
jgi:predicted nucleotidyltransferase